MRFKKASVVAVLAGVSMVALGQSCPAQIPAQDAGVPAGVPPYTPPAQGAPFEQLKQMFAQPPSQGNQPQQLVVPPISFVDVNTGRFGKMEIDLEDGEFMAGSCKNLHMVARNLDLREGVLKSLDIDITDGHFRDFIVDRMTMSTQGAMRFDSGTFLNKRVLQFTEPTEAAVTVEISQESLNKFLNAPSTLDRLSFDAAKKVGAIAGLLGGNAGPIGLSIADARLELGRSESVRINLDSKVGVGQYAVPIPVEVKSRLVIDNGWVQVTDTQLMTSGKEISPQLSQMLVNKVNSLSSLGTRSDDIHFKFTRLTVKSGKKLTVEGTASVNRLRFGRS